MTEENPAADTASISRRTLLAAAVGTGGFSALAVYARSSGVVLRDGGDGFGGGAYGAGAYGE